MQFELKLDRLYSKLGAIAVTLLGCALLGYAVFSLFVTGLLGDERLAADRVTLAKASARYPGSARLHARLAAAELSDRGRDFDSALLHAGRAVDLSPNDYDNHLLLATVQETRGDRAAAESSLREAVRLAPNYTTTRWRLANLLLRIGKPREALDEFNRVVISNRRYLPAALDLIWSASSGSVEAVKEVVRGDAQSQISLAVFLLRQSRLSEAVEIFANAERSARLASTDTPGFLNSLIEKGRAEQARDLWLGLVSEESDRPVVWNGSFESDPVQSFPQFDWAITRTNYARPVIDRTTARTGARSLKIEFAGRDTTKLDREVWQMLALKPGARYELECFVKANDFVTPEGPRIVISGSSTDEIASSAPIAAGTYEWRRVVFEFIAPPAGIVHISIKRTPRFSYDEPTQGTLWIDDIRAIGR